MYEPKYAHGPVSEEFTEALREAVLKINSTEDCSAQAFQDTFLKDSS